LDAAHEADMPLLIGGQVYPYEAHQRYFDEEILPRLDQRRRFLGPLGFAKKRRLLNGARCLLIPSLAQETSSLVAMEALAAGTPVVAFPNGALADIIEHGRTGFLVEDVPGMAHAMREVKAIDSVLCHSIAEGKYSHAAMVDRYFDAYHRLARLKAA
jgi:glycosyltransferase involved in cell wall biosynthesis